jgi:hypothetical protein
MADAEVKPSEIRHRRLQNESHGHVWFRAHARFEAIRPRGDHDKVVTSQYMAASLIHQHCLIVITQYTHTQDTYWKNRSVP